MLPTRFADNHRRDDSGHFVGPRRVDPGVLPSWLSVRNNGNGTALLQGTPPLGTTGTFSVLISPTAAYTNPICHIYPITVANTPIFTSPSTSVFTAGIPASFSISANMGTISLSGTLPKVSHFRAVAVTRRSAERPRREPAASTPHVERRCRDGGDRYPIPDLERE